MSDMTKRIFSPGSEWVYFKIYSGVKTADRILSEFIFPFTEELLKQQKIHKWFFIRYSDPDNHIRLRFHVTDKTHIGDILCSVNELLSPLADAKALWNFQLDTYKREIERYTNEAIELAEELFFHDSVCTTKLLTLIEGDEGEELRWQFGVKSVDKLLEDFGYSLEQKKEIMSMISESFSQEFKINKNLKIQLDNKFRKLRSKIAEVFIEEPQNEEHVILWKLISERSENSKHCIKEIKEVQASEKFPRLLNDLMSSYIHMLMNRLFRTEQRKHELVLYYLLHKHYTSSLARMKKQNKIKQKDVEKVTP